MPEVFLEREEVAAAHHEPTGEVVAKVVKAEVLQAGAGNGILEGGVDSAVRPDPALPRFRHGPENRIDLLTHRDFTPTVRVAAFAAAAAAVEDVTISEGFGLTKSAALPEDSPARRLGFDSRTGRDRTHLFKYVISLHAAHLLPGASSEKLFISGMPASPAMMKSGASRRASPRRFTSKDGLPAP